MAQFSYILTEIISHIFRFIARSDLPNLCLVNKFINDLAEPLLYSTIVLDWDYWNTPPIIPLLRTLFERPELFAYVETVSLHGKVFGDTRTPLPSLDPSNMPLDLFISAIKRSKVPYIDLWVNKLRSGSMDALAGLLIAYLSKTRRLAINNNFINRFEIIGKVLCSKIYSQLPQASNQLPGFEQLNQMIYTKEEDLYYTDHNYIFRDSISLFYLPTITKLLVWLPNPHVFQWPAGEPDLSHLTSLEIEWCTTPFLAKILSLTSGLKSLFWNWEYHEQIGWDPWKISTLDLDQVITALANVKATLETFHFRLILGGGDAPAQELGVILSGSLNGLQDFKQLRHLDIPLICLTGMQSEPHPLGIYLPDSIEVLCLTLPMIFGSRTVEWNVPGIRQRDKITRMILSLLKIRPIRLPKLHSICFLDSDHEIFWYGKLETWVKGFADTIDGINFQATQDAYYGRRRFMYQ